MSLSENFAGYLEYVTGKSQQTEIPEESLRYFAACGILLNCAEENSVEKIALLKSAIQSSADGRLRSLAFRLLTETTEPWRTEALTAIYNLALLDRYQPAVDWLLTQQNIGGNPQQRAVFALLIHGPQTLPSFDPELKHILAYLHTNPDPGLLSRMQAKADLGNWKALHHLLSLAAGLTISEEASQYFVNHYDELTETERARLNDELIRRSAETPAVDLLCEIVIRFPADTLRQYALAHQLAPDETVSLAAYLFMTDQWQRFENLDFDRRLITQAYNQAEPNLRARLLAQARYSGQISWLEQTSQSRSTRWINDLTENDWRLVIAELLESAQFEALWRLAQSAPARWSAQILVQLGQLGWQPEEINANDAFQQLLLHASACQAVLIQPVEIAHAQKPGEDLSCLAAFHQQPLLAIGGSQADIHLWDYHARSWLPPIHGSAAQVRALAVSPDDDYIVCANGDHRIRIYRREGYALVKTLEGHSGLIRNLRFSADGRTLFSAGFDGSLRSWRFPNGPEGAALQQQQGEIFAIDFNAQRQLLISGTADGKVRVWKWPEMQHLRVIDADSGPIFAVCAGSDQLAASWASVSRQLSVWNLLSGQELAALNTSERLIALKIFSEEHWLLTFSTAGEIQTYALPKTEPIAAPINLSADGAALELVSEDLFSAASANGRIALFDYSILRLYDRPAGDQPASQLLEQVRRQRKLKQPEGNIAWLNFIEAQHQWRARFDIQLSRSETFQLGEFDIQL